MEDLTGLLLTDGPIYGTKWISHGVTVHLNVSPNVQVRFAQFRRFYIT